MESEHLWVRRWALPIILIVVLVGVVVFLGIPRSTLKVTSKNIYDQLINSNADYKKGDSLVKQSDYKNAVVAYKSALTSTNDPSQKQYIEYDIAANENLSGDHVAAISLLKSVVADTTLPPDTRASAVQYMARMIDAYDSKTNEAVRQEIFKDPPYSSMVASDDTVTTRHLFEYAISIYPLPISELQVADWYAKHLRFNSIASTTDEGKADIVIIQNDLAAARKVMTISATLPSASTIMPEAMTRIAVITSELAHLGVVSYDTADPAYMAAIDSYKTYHAQPGEDGYARLHYASFLAHTYGMSHASTIHEVISPLYTDQAIYSGSDSSVISYLTTLIGVPSTPNPTNSLENDRLRVRQVAAIDPGFKALLISLGWQASEFVNVPNDMGNMVMPKGMPM